ncbi:MAG: indole-3-glycerol phosphate synthase TrpC [Rhodospirillaceae bacterium]|jgi:indole-3-glycerol phosphate synthase|nr:indole-3-glycerol phosphate synthase TrpC [Rhodospirillaceae bacterium]MBT4691206.1 indole-3-glycerol phosphate synthase TrpC [Rhodospirillaceae bacterium]MBT5082550.1 indole-3-glycerol phosphate synthase TrpC [Rhodospirillaceae bacterium]MBT5526120.1 indole-3-glycerol phosphate synthase TrpC [Rhodospirillaceae bacterium]MBT5879649.1 indole-3-glycerol phosphate synthase TrpC [Rhodospirillaceae bacterium]
MSDILKRICDDKRNHVAACKARRTAADVEAAAKGADPVRGFANALRRAVAAGRHGLIAEVKKASPSKGLIRADFDPATLAQAYARGGASCLSVLTDEPYFQGHDDFLGQARGAVDLPVLRKDFMLDLYQVAEARALGADCILLIMAALDDGLAREMEAAAYHWGMDVLIEVHDADEMARALTLQSNLIGINNRNLKTMVTDLATTEALAAQLPADALGVSESGLNSNDDLTRMNAAGCHCFLVGEALMRQGDVEAAVRNLLNPSETISTGA